MPADQEQRTPEQTLVQLDALVRPIIEFLMAHDHHVPNEIFQVDTSRYTPEEAARYAKEINLMQATIGEYKKAKEALLNNEIPPVPYDQKAYETMLHVANLDLQGIYPHAVACANMLEQSVSLQDKIHARAVVKMYEILITLQSRIRIAIAPFAKPVDPAASGAQR